MHRIKFLHACNAPLDTTIRVGDIRHSGELFFIGDRLYRPCRHMPPAMVAPTSRAVPMAPPF